MRGRLDRTLFLHSGARLRRDGRLRPNFHSMDIGHLSLAAWSYGLAGVVYSAFAVHLLRLEYWRRDRHRAAWALLGAVLSCGLWGWLSVGLVLTDKPLFAAAAPLADLLRFGCWFAFLLILLRPPQGESLSIGATVLRVAAVALTLFGLLAQSLFLLDHALLGDKTRPVLITSMLLSVFGLVLVEQLFRNLPEDSRWNAKPVCLALAGMFLFDLYVYSQAALFNHLDADALQIRGAVHALMAPLLLASTLRHKDWLSKLRISRKAAFHSATLIVAGMYLVFVSSLGYYVRYFGGNWGRALQVGLVFCALVFMVVLAVSGTARAKLRVFVEKNFFRYRYDYREEWLRFTQTLSAQNTPQQMGQQVVRGLADMVESPAGELWTRSSSDSSYSQSARWNAAERPEQESADSSFCRLMALRGWVINLDEYRSQPELYGEFELPAWLADNPQAWLVVPLRVSDDLTGFVVLARPRTAMDVNWEVNDLLKTAGSQAASFLAQMRATEALLEVRKFDAFNRMSAFVVHDLKNIVTQLSLMMTNAKRLRANPEFQQDMLMTVENSLERMRQLMLQLREGSTPAGTAFGVDLGGVVERVASVASGRGRSLEVQLHERLVARGHQERLERIIGHVVQNAFDATDPSGRVWVKLDRFGGQARIEVGDTGHGMTQEFVRDRLFKPFQTTKAAGMGIGAYESFQYVRELGGTIVVNSQPDKGTEVTVLLPMFEAQEESLIRS